MVTVRFAPAPSGYLHLGNIRTALLNWLFAKHHGGQFVLRLDDTDTARCEEKYAEAIQSDLSWLGLIWDSFIRQSASSYEENIEHLKKTGRLYPCYETAEELLENRHKRIVYRQKKENSIRNQKAHWRFALKEEDVFWNDLIRGPTSYHTKHLSDPVLIRENGDISYMLSSVSDDIRLSITHIIRGEDHVTNTAVQIQLFEALEAKSPEFAHFPLLLDTFGQKLSKRLDALSVHQLQEKGVLPMAILHVLAALGTSKGPALALELEDLAKNFSWKDYGRAAPCLDIKNIFDANSFLIQHMSYEDMCDQISFPYPTAALWKVIKDNLGSLLEIPLWQEISSGTLQPSFLSEDAEFLKLALKLLPPPPWTEKTWTGWTQALQTQTGRRGQALYHPLRWALTGQNNGPSLQQLFPLIQPECVYERLRCYE